MRDPRFDPAYSMKFVIIAVLALGVAVNGQSMFDKVNDFDGDGRADYAVTRNENGLKVWLIWRSTSGYLVVQWGVADDRVVAGDYDGDGRTDIAVARVGNSNGNLLNSTYYLSSNTGAIGIAQVEMINIIGSLSFPNEDYDGDGKTDAAIFQWHGVGGVAYRGSASGNTFNTTIGWFQQRTGDVAGGPAADIVSYEPSTSQISIYGGSTLRWGNSSDRWVAADFDGDNKGEIAIFRPATGDWWWIRSSDSVVNTVHWGLNGDIPVPADYDQDGKSDLAVYRPGSPQSVFYVYGSTSGYSAFVFGISTDLPVTY